MIALSGFFSFHASTALDTLIPVPPSKESPAASSNGPQLQHKCLAETHDFSITLTAWREIGTAFTATHRQGSQCILECLCETEELQNGKINGCMETDTTFIWAYRIIELYTICLLYTSVNLKKIALPASCHRRRAAQTTNTNTTKQSLLNNALSHHCVSYFHKPGNVGTLHIINVSVGFRAVFHALCMDAVHDCR